jgi:hypothetical protein
MSVFITLRLKADPSLLQEVMASDSWPAPTGPRSSS